MEPVVVDVDRLDKDTVRVSWTGAAGPMVVELLLGDLDGPVHAAREGVGEAVFEDVPRLPRPWFRVGHVVAGERLLRVAGTLNFRDLGGYPTAEGGHTAWGRVFRSDTFAFSPPKGWQRLRDFGVREIYDLRLDDERLRYPGEMPVDLGIRVTTFPIGGEAAAAPDIVALLKQSDDPAWWLDYMHDMYRGLVTEHGEVFAGLLRCLADPERLPAVFHCMGGKDRTGVAAALLLHVLGVDRETVLDDFELTTAYTTEARLAFVRREWAGHGIDPEAVRAFFSAPREVLAGALELVDERHGSVDGYLAAHGLEPDVPTRLRSLLLARTPRSGG